MNLPDYYNSILNLMSSIAKGFGKKTGYSELSLLNPEEVKKARNVILIILDGMGYEFLQKHGQKSELIKHLRGKITSIFPAATTSCVPAFLTGSSAQEHGMAGWYIFLRELGMIVCPLPGGTRFGEFDFTEDASMKKLFSLKPFADKIKAKSYVLNPSEYYDSDFNVTSAGRAKVLGYSGVKDFFKNIENLIKTPGGKYVYAYHQNPDSLIHKYGNNSKKVLKEFKNIDKEFSRFLKRIKKTDSIVIVTADHGLINVPKDKRINTLKYPKIKDFLRMPICGEGRLGYAYVKAGKEREFEKYVKDNLSFCCDLIRSEEALKRGWFGLGKPHPEFVNRIGDYLMIMKEDYGIKDYLIDSDSHQNSGRHGGTSKEEMFVPLIVARTKN